MTKNLLSILNNESTLVNDDYIETIKIPEKKVEVAPVKMAENDLNLKQEEQKTIPKIPSPVKQASPNKAPIKEESPKKERVVGPAKNIEDA